MEANAGQSFQMQILFNIFPRISLHCKLVPVQYWEYETGLFQLEDEVFSLWLLTNFQIYSTFTPVFVNIFTFGQGYDPVLMRLNYFYSAATANSKLNYSARLPVESVEFKVVFTIAYEAQVKCKVA